MCNQLETDRMTADETLEQWNAQMAEVRARMAAGQRGHPGLADPRELTGRTGLDAMRAMLAGELPHAHIARTLDFEIVEVGEGHAVFQATPQLKHYNPLGSVHGGWYATLLDSAMGCAIHTTLPAGRAYTTAELSINIVRAASADTGPLRTIGRVVHSGRQLATAEGRIVGADGKLYAHGTTTCLVFEATARPAPAPQAAALA
jgi:uncharacterized protein (TIGR00369 family)